MQNDDQRPEVREASIVALGTFNPAIFQPQWFAASKLIRSEEAEKAQIDVINNGLTVFSTEWFRAEVIQERFAISILDPTKNLPLKDLVVGTFQILEHTPISAFGLNCNQDFAMSSADEWHAIGHHYAPKESWSSILDTPGMRLLVMEGKRRGSEAKHVSVRLEPSAKLAPHGVRIAVNEHYELKAEATPPVRMRTFLRTVESVWEPFLKYADDVAQHLLRQPRH